MDEAKIVKRLRKALRGLEHAVSVHPVNGDPQILSALVEQQAVLKGKLEQVAGLEQVRAHEAEERNRTCTVASGGSTSLQARGSATGGTGMSNEQLAHEVMLDKGFRIHGDSYVTEDKLVYAKVKETFARASWECVADELRMDPVVYSGVILVVKEIRESTMKLFPTGCRRQPEPKMEDLIDLDMVTKKLVEGSFGVAEWADLSKNMVEGVLSIHRLMKNSQRIQETNEKWAVIRIKMENVSAADHPKLLCDVLEMILDRVHAVRIPFNLIYLES